MEQLTGLFARALRIDTSDAQTALVLTLTVLIVPLLLFLGLSFTGGMLGRRSRMTSRQSVVTILTPIVLCRGDEVQATLLGATSRLETLFGRLGFVHFARWAVLPGEDRPGWRHIKDELLLHVVVDGDGRTFLTRLVADGRAELDAIYGRCRGYPGDAAKSHVIVRYLRRHVVGDRWIRDFGRSASFNGAVGRSVAQIHSEEKLRRALQDRLATVHAPANCTHDGLRQMVKRHPDTNVAQTAEPPRGPSVRMELRHYVPLLVTSYVVAGLVLFALGLLTRVVGLRAGMVVVLGVAAVGGNVLRLALVTKEIGEADRADRRPEIDRPPERPYRSTGAGKEDIARHEDRAAQSAMLGLNLVKRGLVRAVTLRAVLWFVNFVATYVATRGTLSGIATIHYARWVVVDKGRRLIFCSDYDSTWEAYLGEFVDQAAGGLTAVWSNCVGFPRTLWLTEGGARHEQAFKRYARDSMIPIQFWYTAYPDLSVVNINNSSAIREGLVDGVDTQVSMVSRQGVARPPDSRVPARPAPVDETARPPDTRKMPVDLRDTQGIIIRGYGDLHAACFLLLEIRDPRGARAWLATVAGDGGGPFDEQTMVMNSIERPSRFAVNVAFTRDGLDRLGFETARHVGEKRPGQPEVCHRHRGFLPEFIDGMTTPHRQRILGDVGGSDPRNWVWGRPEADPAADEYASGVRHATVMAHTGHSGVGDAGAKRLDDPDWRPVHVLLMLYAKSRSQIDEERQAGAPAGSPDGIDDLCQHHERLWKRHGLEEIRRLDTNRLKDRKEHFGFRDGISQPVIEGVPKAWDQKAGVNVQAGNVVRAGEFVLGYENEYGEYPASILADEAEDEDGLLFETLGPDGRPRHGQTREFGRNGSYLVFRQLHQRVGDFWRHLDEQTSHPVGGQPRPEDRVRLASKMVGRWPSGAPLIVTPRWDNPAFSDEDRFRYMDVDPTGERCPIGAHVRRANPRDMLGTDPARSLELQKRHRIIRRGRAYGEPVDAGMRVEHLVPPTREQSLTNGNTDGKERGLHFICFNTNISRQFEFVQSRWVNNRVFEGLHNAADPITGWHPPDGGTFTQPAERQATVNGLQRYVDVRGGAYFFMPGIRALRFLSRRGR